MKCLSVLLFALLLCAPAHAAEIYWQDGKLVIEDVISPGDAAKLQEMIKATPVEQLHVHLASRGGDIEESQKLGLILRQNNAVVTHGYCASACVLTFLGGTTRYLNGTEMQDGVALVVHQPVAADAYQRSSNPFMQQAVRQLEEYVLNMTGKLDFYILMMSIPFDTPLALTQEEAFALHVVTDEALSP